MDAMEFLAENVQALRKRYAMSQKDLADAIGTSHPRISDIEAGKGNPSLRTLIRLAGALNTTVGELVSRQPQKKPQKTA